MKIELDLWHAYELRAFATFLTTLADGKVPAETDKKSDPPYPYPPRPTAGPVAEVDIPAGSVIQAVVVEPFTPTGISVNVVTAEEPKRKRRTKAEIEAEKTANISATPEDRVDPEVEAQDAADEAAETEKVDEATKVFGRDDVRSRMTTLLGLMPGNEAEKYAKFASLATPIFNAVLGTPPDGENWRIGLIADNAEHFALLCEGFDAVIRGASNG